MPENKTNASASTTINLEKSSVLGDRVQRTLRIRTDAPATRAALDALATLDDSLPTILNRNGKIVLVDDDDDDNNNNHDNKDAKYKSSMAMLRVGKSSSSSKNVVDARSIRAAIEADAFRHVLLFREGLAKLVDAVTDTRNVVHEASEAARSVAEVVVGDLVPHEKSVSHLSKEVYELQEEKDGDGRSAEIEDSSSSSSQDLEQEENDGEEGLAALLADAFSAREKAKKRLDAAIKFAGRFDLDERDAYLLDEYDFSDLLQSSTGAAHTNSQHHIYGVPSSTRNNIYSGDNYDSKSANGMEFLDALVRVLKIKSDLAATLRASAGGNTKQCNNPKLSRIKHDVDEHNENSSSDDDNDNDNVLLMAGGAEAIRAMESLSARSEKAHERLYNFLVEHLDLRGLSVSHIPTSSNASSSYAQTHSQPGSGRGGMSSAELDESMDGALSHPFVLRSLSILRISAPHYHTHAVEMIAASRRAIVTRRFLLALTEGGNDTYDYGTSTNPIYDHMNNNTNQFNNSNSHQPAIELRAHDPEGYIGDMLAFAHRCLTLESDLASGLFGYHDHQKDFDTLGANGNDDNEHDNLTGATQSPNINPKLTQIDSTTINDVQIDTDNDSSPSRHATPRNILDEAIGGLSRPLYSRMHQVITSLSNERLQSLRKGQSDNLNDDNPVSSHIYKTDPNLNATFGNEFVQGDGQPAGLDGLINIDEHEDDSTASNIRTCIVTLYSICGLLSFYGGAMDRTIKKLESFTTDDIPYLKESSDSEPRINPLCECVQNALKEASSAYAACLQLHALSLPKYVISSSASTSLGPSSISSISIAKIASDTIIAISEARSISPGLQDDEDESWISTSSLSFTESSDIHKVLSLEYLCQTLLHSISRIMQLECDNITSKSNEESYNNTSITELLKSSTSSPVLQLEDSSSLRLAIGTAKSAGLDTSSAKIWEAEIDKIEKSSMDAQVKDSYEKVLQKCGLSSVSKAIDECKHTIQKDKVPQSKFILPGMSLDEVENAVQQFYESLRDPSLIPSFTNVTDPDRRKEARYSTASPLLGIYEQLYKILVTKKNEKENGTENNINIDFLSYDPGQVKDLLSI